MLKRVVITGMGVVSPNGVGVEEFCRAVLEGKSGVRRITRFDTSQLPIHIAGEIPAEEFDELAWVDKQQRKHVSRSVPLADTFYVLANRPVGEPRPCQPLKWNGASAPNGELPTQIYIRL